jgi:Zn-finger nucleic acid-binding protein
MPRSDPRNDAKSRVRPRGTNGADLHAHETRYVVRAAFRDGEGDVRGRGLYAPRRTDDEKPDYATVMTTLCPRCSAPLTEMHSGASWLSALACVRCGGLWLDNARAERVVEGEAASAGSLSRHIARVASGWTRSAANVTDPYRRADIASCPICHAPLMRVATNEPEHGVDDVVLDVCTAHGTWFDVHELEMLAEGVRRKIIREGDAARSARRDGKPGPTTRALDFVIAQMNRGMRLDAE